ncbi:MAG: nitroreductase family deazaflavin-dependent oxidoreductase [Chloroflexi bacterium]|nr:nitroreductase family deazaflavin-dependent oxidoreductase [Chloroflexota bacterium]
MNKKPTALQRFILRVYNLPVLIPFWRVAHQPLDSMTYKLTGGKTSLTEILGGVAMIQLIARGAKSGVERIHPLIGIYDGERIALIASNFGRERNPAWYYNLKANPRCRVNRNGRISDYVACEAEGDEREAYWQKALAVNPGYEKYRRLVPHRRIPVMLLAPLK